MQTTGIFTTHYWPISTKENETNYLIPFGDIHRFAPLCHVEKWKDFLGWAANKKRAYFIGMGDYDDLASTSEREILGSNKLHESSRKTLDKLYIDATKKLAKEIDFMRGRLIGLIEGNHYAELQSGMTTTQYLCHLLECKYLGALSFIRLSLKTARKPYALDVFAHHGKGAARLVGGSVNRVQQMAEQAQADIYLMGHDHKKAVATASKLILSNGGQQLTLKHQKQLYIRTGSFLRGYVENEASYIVDGCMNPTDLGVVKIEMTPKRTDDHISIDLHASI